MEKELLHPNRSTIGLLVPGAIFLLALAARVTFIILRGPIITADTREYLTLAMNLVEYGVFSLDAGPPLIPSVSRPPVYPSFLASLFAIVEPPHPAFYMVVTLTQAVMDAGVAVVILFLAGATVSRGWATAAALTYAVHPGAIVSSSTLLSETLFTVLLAGSIWLLVAGLHRNHPTLVASAGVGLGFAILCRSVALILPLAIVLLLPFARASQPRTRLIVMLLAGFGLVVLPWVVRCTALAQELVLVQAPASINLYLASRVDWDQTNQTVLWDEFYNRDPVGRQWSAARTPAEMVAVDREAWRRGISNILSDPGGYLMSRIRTFPVLFLTSFDVFTGFNESFGSVVSQRNFWRIFAKLCLLFLFSLAPFLLAALGLPGAFQHPAQWVCATVWIYLLALHTPMFVEYRYWRPAVPFMLVSTSIGVARLANRRRPRDVG